MLRLQSLCVCVLVSFVTTARAENKQTCVKQLELIRVVCSQYRYKDNMF